MTTDETYHFVQSQAPKLLYITGKTSTGKTTFSGRLRAAEGYQVIELDQVVHDAVVRPLHLQKQQGDVFGGVYKTADKPEWVDPFVVAARAAVQDLLGQNKKVIVDGAIANIGVVQRVFDGLPSVVILYFHPGPSSQSYINYLTKRFEKTTQSDRNGLPSAFWDLVDKDAFAQFCQDRTITPQLRQSIAAFAQLSTQHSTERLHRYRQAFPSLHTVEV